MDRHAWALFLAPAFFFSTLFWIVPMLGALGLSLTRWNGVGLSRIQWVGLAHYRRLLGDGFFWQALVNTLIFVGGALVFVVGLVLTVALILDAKPRAHAVLATTFFLLVVLSATVIGLLFTQVLSPTTGIMSAVMGGTRLRVPGGRPVARRRRHRDLGHPRGLRLARVRPLGAAVRRRPVGGAARPDRGRAHR